MAQTLPTEKLVTFEEFIEWLPESTFKRYELHDGVIKQPTINVCNLVDGEYQITQFRGDDRILSKTFPDLNLTASQIFRSAGA